MLIVVYPQYTYTCLLMQRAQSKCCTACIVLLYLDVARVMNLNFLLKKNWKNIQNLKQLNIFSILVNLISRQTFFNFIWLFVSCSFLCNKFHGLRMICQLRTIKLWNVFMLLLKVTCCRNIMYSFHMVRLLFFYLQTNRQADWQCMCRSLLIVLVRSIA